MYKTYVIETIILQRADKPILLAISQRDEFRIVAIAIFKYFS